MNLPLSESLEPALLAKVDAIIDQIKTFDRLVVAFSGGVDSTVVAALAHRAIQERALAVTAVSETLASLELEDAKQLAAEIGITHQTIAFSELEDEDFIANTSARCFFCQSMRFSQLQRMGAALGAQVVASGSNLSDLGDHRPGLEAMRRLEVYQPLLEHQIDKNQVRQIARWLGLSAWDKPAKACLSSRIPHGTPVTLERLRRVERAEEVLHALGLKQYRVRDHGGVARIEIASDELDALLVPETLSALNQQLKAAGFERVTLDLVGYRSGSLNPV